MTTAPYPRTRARTRRGRVAQPAVAPDLSGYADVDPGWSRLIEVTDPGTGTAHTWHILDTHAADPDRPVVGTMLCVHGNPTWSYLWRRFLAEALPGWRVVAVDQLSMGWSERLDRSRTLPQRVADLGALTDRLRITGPVVTVGHDWGGIISLGWALQHRDQLAAVVLANTGLDLPVGAELPTLLRPARTPALLRATCVRTPTFVRTAAALSRPALPARVRAELARPYGSAARREAVGDFVADIPLEADHVSRPAFDAIAAGAGDLEVPALLLWGGRDPVFHDGFLDDLERRLPQADVHRYPRAAHLVTEDEPRTATDTWHWIQRHVATSAPQPATEPVPQPTPEAVTWTEDDLPWAALVRRADDPATAAAEVHNGVTSTVSFADLERRIADTAAGLQHFGLQPGDRVAMLVPPGIDLTVAVYACWRVGAVIVVADAGLGVRGMAHALRSAHPRFVIGIGKGLLAIRALGVPGRRIGVGSRTALARIGGWEADLRQIEEDGRGRTLPHRDPADTEGAVLFTSGATGPAKGVVYRQSQLKEQIAKVAGIMRVGPDDRLVAAFAPFALYGPAMGIGAVVPDMDVTAPGTLTAVALADAVRALDATVVFASPAALRNVVASSDALTAEQRALLHGVHTVLSAGAPVPAPLLREVQQLLPNAELHTPYGMTEVLPATDISLAEIESAGRGNGVCVGLPLPGVTLRVSPLDEQGRADGPLTDQVGVTGEICIAAAHRKDRYDRLWATEQAASRNPGYHRTGDVGHLDDHGRLWVEGRLLHVISTADGPVTPVRVEQRIEELPQVRSAAAVGVGPTGTQQVVAVVVPTGAAPSRQHVADPDLAAAVRAVSTVPLAAVLVLDALPVDIRHASKVDRTRLARWAGRLLAGERAGKV
ncbi:Acyl-CoA synthetase (AMP-forming)/AMP-acid ligase II [Microlunatus soli]|uniref:Acyl-CoA synthetase (AMP-forming)/AMP-acid ligase II n=1 Tax=Microlunatus soli TaxID=630515 RepID=A0A1H1ZK94_9ACTN|nr:Acyl-CoA synthetase (AMP-forming)/AMP-acid ligase II [Microlunatus soli]